MFRCDAAERETGRTDSQLPVTATAMDREPECKNVDLAFAPENHGCIALGIIFEELDRHIGTVAIDLPWMTADASVDALASEAELIQPRNNLADFLLR